MLPRTWALYLVNHSLPKPVLDVAFDWTKRFFSLPEEDKMKAPSSPRMGSVEISHVSAGNNDELLKQMKQVSAVKVSNK